jgi:hypothetical protein
MTPHHHHPGSWSLGLGDDDKKDVSEGAKAALKCDKLRKWLKRCFM